MSQTQTRPTPAAVANPVESTAIVVADGVRVPSNNLRDANEIATTIRGLRGKVHLLAPSTVGQLPPSYEVAFRVVQFTPVQGGESPDFHKVDGGKFSLLKHALHKLLAASNGTILAEHTRRIDDRKRNHFFEWQAAVRITGIDGQTRDVVGTRVVDLRDGSPEAIAAQGTDLGTEKGAAKLHAKRLHAAANCESKAILRAIRAALGIRSYTAGETGVPFVCPVPVFVPDMSNPVVAEMVTAHALGIAKDVYGNRERRALPEPPPAPAPTRVEAIDVEAEPVSAPPRTQAPAERPATAPEQRPAPPAKAAKQPAHPDQDPRTFTPCCEYDGCGVEVPKNLASLTADQYGKILCREHLEEEGS